MKSVFVVTLYDLNNKPIQRGIFDTIEQARSDGLLRYKQYAPARWASLVDDYEGDSDEAGATLLEYAEEMYAEMGLTLQEVELNFYYGY